MNRLEDVMNQYQPDEETLHQTGLSKLPLTAREQQDLLQKVLAKAGLEETKNVEPRKTKIAKRKLWPFAIACVLVLVMGSIAVAGIALDKDFMSFFKPEKQEQIDTLNQAGAALAAQAEDSGLAVTARQVIGDAHTTFVLFDVTAPADMVLDQEQYLFAQPFVTVDGANSLGYYFEMLADDNPSDNKVSMLLVLDSGQEIQGKKLNMNLTDFCTYKPYDPDLDPAGADNALDATEPQTATDDGYDHLVEGNWKLSFKLAYQDLSQVYDLDKTAKVFDGECDLYQMNVSPLTVSLKLKGQAIAKFDENPPEDPSASDYFEALAVTLKDGSVVPIVSGGSSIDRKNMVINYQFGQVISPADIASITFLGQELLAQ